MRNCYFRFLICPVLVGGLFGGTSSPAQQPPGSRLTTAVPFLRVSPGARGAGNRGNFMVADAQGVQLGGTPESPGRYLFTERDHQYTARFSGGYRLTNSAASIGVRLAPGASSWNTLSDVRRKENFKPVNGEDLLKRIGTFRLMTWNYKGQDARWHGHYGPMSQDFFAASGSDGIGLIGNDTAISAADFDGINFAGVKALVDRTEQLRQKDRELEQKTRHINLSTLSTLNENKNPFSSPADFR